jgi:hypothetical protein
MVATLLVLGLLAMTAEVATGQTPDTECQVGRERLAGHARASEAVRKLVAARAGTTATGPTGAGAPGPPPPGAARRKSARASRKSRASASGWTTCGWPRW